MGVKIIFSNTSNGVMSRYNKLTEQTAISFTVLM